MAAKRCGTEKFVITRAVFPSQLLEILKVDGNRMGQTQPSPRQSSRSTRFLASPTILDQSYFSVSPSRGTLFSPPAGASFPDGKVCRGTSTFRPFRRPTTRCPSRSFVRTADEAAAHQRFRVSLATQRWGCLAFLAAAMVPSNGLLYSQWGAKRSLAGIVGSSS